ncbi:hypothetical protein BH11PSE3_BH11PSE3_17850 [soil metagenome]
MSDFVDGLKSLHTALIDSREGYKEALADAEGKGLTPLFRAFIELRTQHHAELHGLLRDSGESPDDSGSFMSVVHRSVIKVRSVFTGLDENILPGLIDGEKRIVEHYQDVELLAPAPAARAVLARQRAAVASKIVEMERMRKV